MNGQTNVDDQWNPLTSAAEFGAGKLVSMNAEYYPGGMMDMNRMALMILTFSDRPLRTNSCRLGTPSMIIYITFILRETKYSPSTKMS